MNFSPEFQKFQNPKGPNSTNLKLFPTNLRLLFPSLNYLFPLNESDTTLKKPTKYITGNNKADQRDVYLSKSVAALGDGRSILTDPLESMPNVYTLSKNSPSPISVVELPISPQRKRHYCQKIYKLHLS